MAAEVVYNDSPWVEVDPDDLDKPEVPKKQGKCKKIGKIVLKQMFSSIGLCVLLGLYCVGGGFLLRVMEEPAEQDRNNATIEMSRTMQVETDRLKDILLKYRNASVNEKNRALWGKDPAYQAFKASIEAYQVYTADAIANMSYAGDVPDDHMTDDFGIVSCILFSVTIITLVGYGHIYPFTEAGQIMVIVYSLLGVPLTLMFLAKVGEGLSSGIRWIWGKITSYQKKHPTVVDEATGEERATVVKDIPVPPYFSILVLLAFIFFGAGIFMIQDKWSFVESIYFVIVSITTIGFGDLVPGLEHIETTKGQLLLAFLSLYLVVGLAMLSMVIGLLIEGFQQSGAKLGEKIRAHKAKLAEKLAAKKNGKVDAGLDAGTLSMNEAAII